MATLKVQPSTSGPMRGLLDAWQALDDARDAHTRALAAYDQALAEVKRQDETKEGA
jgi:hypothetical protein